MPKVMVDRLMVDACKHGFTTLSDFIRKIVAHSDLTSIIDVNEMGLVVWGKRERTIVAGARTALQAQYAAPVARRKPIV